MSAIEVKNLVKKFHGQTVLHGIDLNVQRGSGGDHRPQRLR
jgi:cystine transport system ATP-binding protein